MKHLFWAIALVSGMGCHPGPSPSEPRKDPAGSSAMKGSDDQHSSAPQGAGPALERTGFAVRQKDGRLWVFYEGSKEVAEYDKNGELAKQFVRIGDGPGGMTIKGPDADTALAYLEARPGFVTRGRDGRLWVFRAGVSELADFDKSGELAKQVMRIGAGPGGVTLKGLDGETLEAFMAAPKYP